jgi:pilus assembly protein FimV
MGYQKSKHVESAQKFLQQGKIQQAVAEYLIVLKHEPKDQVTLMTVGDLFVRQGETFQALEYFERLAHIYLADGFLTKAIAIYKKITKLAPEEMRPIERLADLYVQQGVMSEARPIYLQMADMHQKANRPAQAVGLLRKLLDAEPENPRVQTRLAELLITTGQPAEAADVLRTAAQQVLRRGDHAEALKLIDRTLKIDSADAASLSLRARALAGSGKQSDAVQMLESLPDADAGGESSNLLVELYLEAGDLLRAGELAERIHARAPKHYAVVQKVAVAFLDHEETERALALLTLIHTSAIENGEHEHLADLLIRIAQAIPGRIEPLAALVDLYRRTSDSFRLPDALIHLAEAYEAAGQVEPALETYAEFLQREPENDAVRRKHEQLRAQPGMAPRAVAAEPVITQPVDPAAEEEESAAPVTRPAQEEILDQETQLFISQAMTDVDLYSSYGLTQKALELLDIILQRAPDYPPALERLLDLSVGANNDVRAVELASRLERIYTECGDQAAADRFADLRRRFERAASSQLQTPQEEAPAESESAVAVEKGQAAAVPTVVADPYAPETANSPAEFVIPVVDAQPEPEALADFPDPTPNLDSVVHEVDLSEEWAALSGTAVESATNAELPAADNVVADYESLLNEVKGSGFPAELLAVEPEPITVELEEATGPEDEPSEGQPDELTDLPVIEAVADPAVQDLLAEYERALTGAAEVPAAAEESNGMDSFMRSISAEMDAILPTPLPPAGPRVPAAKAKAEPPAKAPANRGPLGEVFEEFRADMGETGDKDDPETHYNMGTAYREMGLMEEAISEFQKAASAHQQGHPFRYAMQCYTLLALAFAEKGQPSIAVSWYERALQVPGLDPETVLALRYDLGVSQEMAGDMEAAHKSFSQVYGTNIDYRDVAERLAVLGRTR